MLYVLHKQRGSSSSLQQCYPVTSTSSSGNLTRGSSVSNTSAGNITRDSSVSNTWDDTSDGKITRGSYITIFLNDTTSYWVSASGNAKFGFYKIICHWYDLSYPFCADRHVVGIAVVKCKSLLWTTDRDDYKMPSSIFLNNEGKLMISEDNTEQQLLIPGIQEPASYAMMHDNGNFVLYGSESQVVWQSFAHPSNSDLSALEICLFIVKLFLSCALCFLIVKIFGVFGAILVLVMCLVALILGVLKY